MNPRYEAALSAVMKLQSGHDKLEFRRNAGLKLAETALPQMRKWLRQIGYAPDDLEKLKILHIAGTKGKGSTCAYLESILKVCSAKYGFPRKAACYTSPHHETILERIRIDYRPLSEELFIKYSTATLEKLDKCHLPNFFRFLTLLSFHTLLEEGVDVAIYEVGVGGEFDSTNIIPCPVATGITALGLDHTKTLGDTIQKIAWHKSGIFKTGSPAFSVKQPPEAMQILRERAQEKRVDLEIVDIYPEIYEMDLQPPKDFQRENASLAVRLAQSLLTRQGILQPLERLPVAVVREGLENTQWPGRFEKVVRGTIEWRIDGAHTRESLPIAGEWFVEQISGKPTTRILIFNQQSQRDGIALLRTLYDALSSLGSLKFHHVIFTTNFTYIGNQYKIDFMNYNADREATIAMTHQKNYANAWRSWEPQAEISVTATIEDAVQLVSRINQQNGPVSVLVTGSLHTTGGVAHHLNRLLNPL